MRSGVGRVDRRVRIVRKLLAGGSIGAAFSVVAATAPAAAQAASGGNQPGMVSRPVVQQLAAPRSTSLPAALARLARDPSDVEALIAAGTASLALGDSEAALGFLNRADRLAPGNPRVKASLAGALVRNRNPYDALRMFAEAERAGASAAAFAGDRGLAYDLVGANEHAQYYYRQALASAPNEEVTRQLALSQAIAGDRKGFEATLLPQLKRNVASAWRTRIFGLAILGDANEAASIARTTLPRALAQEITPYLHYMPRLTAAQQAAAVNLGHFPRAAQIGRDDPRVAQYAAAVPARGVRADAGLIPAGEPLGARSTAQPSRQERRSAARVQAANSGRVTAAQASAAQPRAGRKARKGQFVPVATQPRYVSSAPVRAAPPAQPAYAVLPSVPAARPAVAQAQPVYAARPPAPSQLAAPPQAVHAPTPLPPRAVSVAPAPLPSTPAPNAPGAGYGAFVPQGTVQVAAAYPPPSPPAAMRPGTYAAAPTPFAAPAPLASGPLSPVVFGPPTTAADLPEPAPRPAAGLDLVEAFRDFCPPEEERLGSPAVGTRSMEPPRPALTSSPSAAVAQSTRPAVEARKPAPVAGKPASEGDKLAIKSDKPANVAKAAPVQHPSRTWVQVGLGQSNQALAYDWKRMARAAPDVFRGRKPSLIAWGKNKRMLAGPFDNSAAAQSFVNSLGAKDIPAFVWASETGQAAERLPGA